jgi:hypothetical protein
MTGNILYSYFNKDKPKNAVIGGVLLYVAFALEMGYNWLRGMNAFDFIAFLLLIGYIVFAVNEGKKWARIVILIITIIKTVTVPLNLIYMESKSEVWILFLIILCLDYVVEVAAIFLLFSKSASIWFNRKSAALTE